MADPIDINGKKKDVERTEELKITLHTLFVEAIELQNRINMRAEDLVKDAADHASRINEMIAELYTKYPELQPDLEEEEVEE